MNAAVPSPESRAPEATSEAKIHPLSFAQKLFQSYYAGLPDPRVQHIYSAFQLSGPLAIDTFIAAIDALARRHPILLAAYVAGPRGATGMRIDTLRRVPVEVIDLSGLDRTEAERRGRELANASVLERFDLWNGPLMRARLLRLSADEHVLVFVFHHSIFDGQSLMIAIRDLGVLYTSIANGRPCPLEATACCTGYTEQLLHWVTTQDGRRHIEYWKERFEGACSPYWLPADDELDGAPSAPSSAPRGGAGGATFEQLRELARRSQASMFVVAAAGLAVVLRHWSARDDVFCCVLHSGRSQLRYAASIGFFAECWVLRVDLSGAPSFREVLSRVRAAYIEGMPHVQAPYWTVKDDLARAGEEQPLLDIVLSHVPLARSPMARSMGLGDDLSMAPSDWLELHNDIDTASGIKLFVATMEMPDSLSWFMLGSQARFRSSTVERCSAALSQVFEIAAVDPERSITSYPLPL